MYIYTHTHQIVLDFNFFICCMYFRISFFNEFEPINPKVPLKKQSEDLRAGSAFEPKNVYDVLPVMKTSLSEKVSVILFGFKYKFGVMSIQASSVRTSRLELFRRKLF